MMTQPLRPRSGRIATRSARLGATLLSAIASVSVAPSARAQEAAGSGVALNPIEVTNPNVPAFVGYATAARLDTQRVDLGPLGTTKLLDTPYSITVVPQDLIVNQQARSINDVLRYLPSVQIESRQGVDISRAQSRGFESSIVQNTRIDGLNAIGTTAYPAEQFDHVQVLNGLAGAIYGPAAPAGVFDYSLKRPTDVPLNRAILGFDSNGTFTQAADLAGRAGFDNNLGYRINVVHGEGQGFVDRSHLDRTLISGAVDVHVTDQTVLELNASHYDFKQTGFPGQFSYGTGKSTFLPNAPDPTRVGLGQQNSGLDLETTLGVVRLKHDFGNDWHLTLGGLYEVANRGLSGINNNFTDNVGAFSTQRNFDAVAKFTIGSNSAYLDGHIETFGLTHDVAIGTNGYVNGQYSGRNSILQTLGTASLASPRLFNTPPIENGGIYESSEVSQQALVVSDTLHFNEQWALSSVLSTSWLGIRNHAKTGLLTSKYDVDAALSPTESLIFKPRQDITTYFTYANSLQQGDTAPTTGVTNPGSTLAPYRSEQYEVGVKYAVTPTLTIGTAGFHITRPFAFTDPVDLTFKTEGNQRNFGAEVFAAGDLTPELSAFGGFTWIDSKLLDTGNPLTTGKDVVGVADWQSNVLLDYHPEALRGLAFTANIHYTGTRAATNTNSQYVDPYATLDLGVRYTTRVLQYPTTFRAQVNNVTDTHYWASIFPSSINGLAGANSAYLGSPRTVSASLEVNF